jgi:hypothetical protein
MIKRASFTLAVLLAACSDPLGIPSAWQAALTPTTAENVRGQVAAASLPQPSLETGMDVEGAPQTTYGWQINRGTCAQPGAMLGGRANYPDARTNDAGLGRVERTFVSGRLEEGNAYHAVIVNSTNRSLILACGEMEQQSFD